MRSSPHFSVIATGAVRPVVTVARDDTGGPEGQPEEVRPCHDLLGTRREKSLGMNTVEWGWY